jgi:hypothetical protein
MVDIYGRFGVISTFTVTRTEDATVVSYLMPLEESFVIIVIMRDSSVYSESVTKFAELRCYFRNF